MPARARSVLPRLAAAASSLACAGAMAGWVLEHQEDFTAGATLDTQFWQHEVGFQRNREEQYYAPGNVTATGSVLRLEGRVQPVPNAQWRSHAAESDWRHARREARYTSGSIVSRQAFQFGRLEVVARAPSGAGVWPAIWLVHEGPTAYGEIDLFEAVGKHPDTVFAGVHWGREPRTRKHRNESRVVPGFEGRWHTHTLEWTPRGITMALDGQPWFRFDPDDARLPGGPDPLRLPMRLRINLALGGNWGGPIDDARLPARFEIASIRWWRWVDGQGEAVSVLRRGPGTSAPADGADPAAQAAPAPAVPNPSLERAAPPARWGR